MMLAGKTEDGMNIRRGLFRLWCLAAILFAVIVGASTAPNIVREFEEGRLLREKARDLRELMAGDPLVVPVLCDKARGVPAMDYSIGGPASGCWYELPKFRVLYPEYNDLNDEALSDKLYDSVPGSKAPAGLPRHWQHLLTALGVMVGIPAAVLVLGLGLLWAIDGFKPRAS
jgi:hypothetical protein